MQNFIFSANVVLPLLILMVLGYVARQNKMLNSNTISSCNNFIFNIFLPCLIFNNIKKSNPENYNDFGIFIFMFIIISVVFLIVSLIVVGIEKSNYNRSAMIQGMCRPNYAMFGLPLMMMLYPDTDVSIAALIAVVSIPMSNIIGVISLTVFGDKKASIKAVLFGIIKNPLIIASVAGLICINIEFPKFIQTTLNNVTVAASPISLFILGASLEFNEISKLLKQIFISVAGKLVLVPLIIVPVAIILGYRGVELATIMIVAASPTATASYTMTEKMGGNANLASSVIVITSILAVITVFLQIFILKSFSLL